MDDDGARRRCISTSSGTFQDTGVGSDDDTAIGKIEPHTRPYHSLPSFCPSGGASESICLCRWTPVLVRVHHTFDLPASIVLYAFTLKLRLLHPFVRRG